jgi:UMF1 family MFS transporter
MLDKSPVEQREIRGFNFFGIATESFGGIAVSVFLPIILQSLAAGVAVESSDRVTPCRAVGQYSCVVQIGTIFIDTSSLVLYATSISVLFQFILFTTLSALADYGNHRKQLMVILGLATAVLGVCFLFVTNVNLYWLAYIIFIFSNTLYGASYVFYYSFIPVLTRFSPEVIKANKDPSVSDETYYKISDKKGNEISSHGFFLGYVTSCTQMVIATVFAIFIGRFVRNWNLTPVYHLQIVVAALSIWQFLIILLFTDRLMKSRPGPDLPKGENYVQFSISKLKKTLGQAPKLSQLFLFLSGWFFYSDSFGTINSTAILFAQAELGADVPLLLISAIVVTFFAFIGNKLWFWIQFRLGLTTRKVLMIQCLLFMLFPLWGLLGFFTQRGTFGLQSRIEVPLLGAYYGLLVGATQSSCRVLFSELIPHGHEAEFFGLYEITDKGSSWFGPLITGAIADATGTLRWAFVFIFLVLIIPFVLFWKLDVPKGKAQSKAFIAQESRHHFDDAA